MTHGPHRTAKALPLIITLLCAASVCLSAEAAAAAAAEQTESRQWEPLRIHVSTRDLEDPARYCNKAGVLRPNYRGNTFTCTNNDVLTDERRIAMLQEVIPAAVKLHTDRLLVQRVSGPLQVPQFDEKNRCMHFTVPEEHRNPGVSNADMVLYVAIVPGFFFGGHCAVGSDKRPISGYMLLEDSGSRPYYFVRATAHEIAHALGFDYDLMSELRMLKKVTVDGKEVTVVNSSKVVEKARWYFNCGPVDVEKVLTVEGSTQLNWVHKFTRGDLMALPSGVSGYYSALTMAAFEDMGFFRAQWGMQEPMSLGRNVGCDFPPKECTAETIRKHPDTYCHRSRRGYHCGINRIALGQCTSIPKAESDVCGQIESNIACDAQRSIDDEELLGSLTGRGSWCLDAAVKVRQTFGGFVNHAGVCARVKCEGGKVHVRHIADTAWHECPEGTIIKLQDYYITGRIICPKYAEVCTIAEDGSSLVKADTTFSSSPDAGIEVGSTSTSTPSSSLADGTLTSTRCHVSLALIAAAALALIV